MRVLFLLLIILSITLAIQVLVSIIPQVRVAIMTDAGLIPVSDTEYATTSNIISLIDGDLIDVPVGFRTTLNAIPHSILSTFKPDIVESAIIHDYLYHCPGNLTRMEADAIFYHCLLSEGVSGYKAKKYYLFARIFGASYWAKNAECYPNPDSSDIE